MYTADSGDNCLLYAYTCRSLSLWVLETLLSGEYGEKHLQEESSKIQSALDIILFSTIIPFINTGQLKTLNDHVLRQDEDTAQSSHGFNGY